MIAINYWQICKFASINYIFWAEQAAKIAKRDNLSRLFYVTSNILQRYNNATVKH